MAGEALDGRIGCDAAVGVAKRLAAGGTPSTDGAPGISSGVWGPQIGGGGGEEGIVRETGKESVGRERLKSVQRGGARAEVGVAEDGGWW